MQSVDQRNHRHQSRQSVTRAFQRLHGAPDEPHHVTHWPDGLPRARDHEKLGLHNWRNRNKNLARPILRSRKVKE